MVLLEIFWRIWKAFMVKLSDQFVISMSVVHNRNVINNVSLFPLGALDHNIISVTYYYDTYKKHPKT